MGSNKVRLKTLSGRTADELDNYVNRFLGSLEVGQDPKLSYRHTSARLICHVEYIDVKRG